jgi:hypothetical protein
VTHQEAVATLAAERYLLDEMAPDQRDAFELHFFTCDECAAGMRSAAALIDGAREQPAQARGGQVVPMHAHAAARSAGRWRRSTTLPWAVAAALAGIVTYQTLWVVPSLRGGTGPAALVPVTLHPESRGGETVVPRPAGNAPVTLAVDVNDAPSGRELGYALTTAEGQPVVSGRVPPPAPGTPLLLLMPAWTLTGSMHYILTVHDTAAPGRSLGDYRFAVSPP